MWCSSSPFHTVKTWQPRWARHDTLPVIRTTYDLLNLSSCHWLQEPPMTPNTHQLQSACFVSSLMNSDLCYENNYIRRINLWGLLPHAPLVKTAKTVYKQILIFWEQDLINYQFMWIGFCVKSPLLTLPVQRSPSRSVSLSHSGPATFLHFWLCSRSCRRHSRHCRLFSPSWCCCPLEGPAGPSAFS